MPTNSCKQRRLRQSIKAIRAASVHPVQKPEVLERVSFASLLESDKQLALHLQTFLILEAFHYRARELFGAAPRWQHNSCEEYHQYLLAYYRLEGCSGVRQKISKGREELQDSLVKHLNRSEVALKLWSFLVRDKLANELADAIIYDQDASDASYSNAELAQLECSQAASECFDEVLSDDSVPLLSAYARASKFGDDAQARAFFLATAMKVTAYSSLALEIENAAAAVADRTFGSIMENFQRAKAKAERRGGILVRGFSDETFYAVSKIAELTGLELASIWSQINDPYHNLAHQFADSEGEGEICRRSVSKERMPENFEELFINSSVVQDIIGQVFFGHRCTDCSLHNLLDGSSVESLIEREAEYWERVLESQMYDY
ncbi:MAG: hypothetical protein SFV17_05350 [Candidatus Obscuribacter sp.]|nr:hypothetical protein [Candidatus Obscuribacter sp.]